MLYPQEPSASMAKASKSEVSSDEAYSSEEEAQVNDQVNVEEDDDEELHAVAHSADSDEEAPASDDEVVPVEDVDDEVSSSIWISILVFAVSLLEILNFLFNDGY